MPIFGSLHLQEQSNGGFLTQAGKGTQKDLAKFDYLGADELVVIDMLESVLATLRTRYAVLKQQREEEAEAKQIKAQEAAREEAERREQRRLDRLRRHEMMTSGVEDEEEDEEEDELPGPPRNAPRV